MEIWKPVKEFDGLYMVSNMGNVKKIAHEVVKNGKKIRYSERIVMPQNNGTVIYLNGKGKSIKKLVADAFIPNPEYKSRVTNINGDKSDNRVVNLQWKSGYPDEIYTKCKKKVICDGKEFESITKCAEYYGVRNNSMTSWLTGRVKMPKKFVILNLRYV